MYVGVVYVTETSNISINHQAILVCTYTPPFPYFTFHSSLSHLPPPNTTNTAVMSISNSSLIIYFQA